MNVIILAAGKGTRMKSDIPKCAYPLKNKPMITYILDTLNELKVNKIFIVVGYQKDVLVRIINGMKQDNIILIEQFPQLGTAHAVKCCDEEMKYLNGDTLILLGDMPLIDKDILKNFITCHRLNHNEFTILTTNISNPTGYGRIIKQTGKVIKIVEEKDATLLEKEITEINTGIYCINNQLLFQNIYKINNNNAQKEYYLTDLVEIMAPNYKVETYIVNYNYHLRGINDLKTLKEIEKMMEERSERMD